MKLLLFDIDGTILMTNGIGRRLIEGVLLDVCQRRVSSAGVSFSGKTDPQIIGEVLARSGFSNHEAAPLMPRALRDYEERAHGAITPQDIAVLPGVRALLGRLSREESVQLALLTGNLRRTAYLKLKAARLSSLFPFGAFGSDHADRMRLPEVAARRAFAYSGHRFSGRDIVIIGDSIHDVQCSRGAGAYAVAVASGVTLHAALAAEAPDLMLEDLTNADLFYRRVMGRAV